MPGSAWKERCKTARKGGEDEPFFVFIAINALDVKCPFLKLV